MVLHSLGGRALAGVHPVVFRLAEQAGTEIPHQLAPALPDLRMIQPLCKCLPVGAGNSIAEFFNYPGPTPALVLSFNDHCLWQKVGPTGFDPRRLSDAFL